MKPAYSALFTFVLCCMMVLALLLVPQAAKAQSPWTAYVGAETKNEANQGDGFFPNELWIWQGDTITWKWTPLHEVHTVTVLLPGQVRPAPGGCIVFPSPASYDGSTQCVGTPPQAPDDPGFTGPYSIKFTAAGNYKFVCLIHTNMNGTVHVLQNSNSAAPFYATSLPFVQPDYDKQASDEAKDLIGDSDNPKEEQSDFPKSANEVIMTGEVSATAGGRQYLAIVRFYPQSIEINKGDTVEFANLDPTEPHTVTSGQDDTLTSDPIPVNVGHASDGALTFTATTANWVNAADPGTGLNTGFLQAAPEDAITRAQSNPGTTRIRITFNSVGTFYYHCALHDVDGMSGKVIVDGHDDGDHDKDDH